MQIIRDWHLEYIKNSYDLIIKTNNPIKNGPKIWIDISLKKIYKWPIST